MKKQYEELKNKIFGTDELGELYWELDLLIDKVERESLKSDNNLRYEIYYDIEDNSFHAYEFTNSSESLVTNGLIWLISIDNSYNDEFFASERAWYEDETATEEQIIRAAIDSIVEHVMDEVFENLNTQIAEEKGVI